MVVKTIIKISAETLQKIEKLLLVNKVRLREIPFEIRVMHKELYVLAFRTDRNISLKRYNKDLKLFESDITSLNCHIKNLNRLYEVMDDNKKFIRQGVQLLREK